MSDKTVSVLLIGFWIFSIVLILVFVYKLQKSIVQDTENKIKLKEDEIEKQINSESIDQLIDNNNKSHKS